MMIMSAANTKLKQYIVKNLRIPKFALESNFMVAKDDVRDMLIRTYRNISQKEIVPLRPSLQGFNLL